MKWIVQLSIVIVSYDIWFYYFHRLLHTKWFYVYHKRHHEYVKNVSAKATFHADLFENLLSGAGVIFPWFYLPDVEASAVLAGSMACTVMGIIHHDPHLVRLSALKWVFDDHHIRHHHFFNGNYGRFWIDVLHGTVIE